MSGDNNFFKIQIIEEIKNLCFIYPSKCNLILNFLANNLRDEESYQFKVNTINAIILIINEIPNSADNAILQLCEYIEDCEYNSLLLRVIRFLLLHIPKTKNPSNYIRYIYNRLILENETIRVDGLYSLFYIATKCTDNSKDILIKIKYLLNYNDDEVRDRANFLNFMLSENIKKLENIQSKVVNKDDSSTCGIHNRDISMDPNENTLLDELQTVEQPEYIDNLLYHITNHIENNIETFFDYTNVAYEMMNNQNINKDGSVCHSKRKSSISDFTGTLNKSNSMSKIIELATDYNYTEKTSIFTNMYNMGQLKLITKSVALTEAEAEYNVFVKKYIYQNNFMVLEFNINNTLNEQILTNINLQISSYNKVWTILEKTSIHNLYYNSPQNLYILLKKNVPFLNDEEVDDITSQNQEQIYNADNQQEESPYNVNQTFQAALQFMTKEHEEGEDDGFIDTYSINPITIQITDFIYPKMLRSNEFGHMWENMASLNSEVVSKFVLSFENIQLAVVGLLNTLNMMACNSTDIIQPEVNNHNMLLSGKFLNESYILCKASLVLSQQYGCLLKICCRSKCKKLSEVVLKSLE
uniref:Coatomer subunit gamma n=1 Tax=Piliocolobus tephrosceles TaxID=591936 RepID=A0A8C9GN25_9PRIM